MKLKYLLTTAILAVATLSSCSRPARGMMNFQKAYPESEISRVPDTNWAVVRKPTGEIRLVLSRGHDVATPYYDIKIMDPMKNTKKEK